MLAGQPIGQPFEVWAVPEAAAWSLAHLGALARPPRHRQHSSLRRSAWLGTGWRMICW